MTHGADTAPSGRIPTEVARSWRLGAAAIAAVGAVGSIAAYAVDPRRFAFSYLVAFVYVATLAVGGLFFILLQHLTRAGWSSAARRQMEWAAGGLPFLAVLFVPVALNVGRIYEWLTPEGMADPEIAKKRAYLNATAFFVRAAVFFGVWALIATWFTRTSRGQDTSNEPEVATAKMQRAAAPAVLASGVALSFAGFDWLMSLDPRWYSTIFGVYVIAGSLVSSFAMLALMTLTIERLGVYGRVSTVEHRHDIGKFMFGFTVFWAYIAFSQYFLIWYANIPEETIFFLHRWTGTWKEVSLLLAFGQFVVPFVLLLSRHGKRNPFVLGLAATIILVIHYVDIYWLVMPTLNKEGFAVSWIDGATLLLPLGALLFQLARRASHDPVYALRDPRLSEAKQLENF